MKLLMKLYHTSCLFCAHPVSTHPPGCPLSSKFFLPLWVLLGTPFYPWLFCVWVLYASLDINWRETNALSSFFWDFQITITLPTTSVSTQCSQCVTQWHNSVSNSCEGFSGHQAPCHIIFNLTVTLYGWQEAISKMGIYAYTWQVRIELRSVWLWGPCAGWPIGDVQLELLLSSFLPLLWPFCGSQSHADRFLLAHDYEFTLIYQLMTLDPGKVRAY